MPPTPASAPARSAGTRAVRVALDGTVPAGHEALLVRDDPHPFALVGRWSGGGALVGSEPVRVAEAREDPFALLGGAGSVSIDASLVTDATSMHDPPPAEAHPAGFVGGGWFGYLGFGLGAPTEALDPSPPRRERLPAFALARYDHLLRLDADGQWWFEALWTPERESELTTRLETLRARLGAGVPPLGPVATGPWRSDPSPAGHARAVEACRERIAAGDLYQANLALRLRSTLDGDPADLFARGVAALAPDRAAFLAGDWGAVASLSPELFLERQGSRVRSAPIKGTRRRSDDPVAAADARAELLASEKDGAENVMIVDLVRNDLGRVCVPGSVRVTARADARPHPGVWHLVSEVEGELRPDVDDAALLRATFPPGSVTGAPKLAALAVIAELESTARQAFTGAIGFASPVAGLELNVAIRTFEIAPRPPGPQPGAPPEAAASGASEHRPGAGTPIWLDVGGGIVADSDPDAEAAEALVKATPLLGAIGAEVAEPPTKTSAPAPPRLGPRPLPRPDAAVGIFETGLVVNGEPIALDRHLARLRASMAALYGAPADDDLEERARAAAAAAGGPCRLRLLAGSGATPVLVETAPLPADSGELTLSPVTVPGGLGAHKWRDRRLLDALTAATAPAIPLLVDLDGYVLEGAWANVLIVTADGALATPPLDGRILPGITRARVLEDAAARGTPVAERPIALTELATAEEVLLTSSLRGTVRAQLSPGPTAPAAPSASARRVRAGGR